MNKKLTIIIMIVTMITMLSLDLFAQGPRDCFAGERGAKGFHHKPGFGKDGPGGGFHNLARMKEYLELTDSQIKKITAINLRYKKMMLELLEKLVPKEIRLRRLLLEDKVDMDKVEAQLKEISESRYQMRLNRIKHRLEIRNLLTDEQKMKLRNIRGGMRGRLGRR